jgi:hypothetical protein
MNFNQCLRGLGCFVCFSLSSTAYGIEAAVPKSAEVSNHTERTLWIEGGLYTVTFDARRATDLLPWVDEKLIPVVRDWYPKIVEMLPGKGFEAPRQVRIVFTDEYLGVAVTEGATIRCGVGWFRRELQREALGAVVHELVHVAQSYGNRQGGAPGWLVEGLADYIRWFLYEPESRGAVISRQKADSVRHDEGYRVSANFLNHVIARYDKELLPELNHALRQGHYTPELWKRRTGRTLEELIVDWKAALAQP